MKCDTPNCKGEATHSFHYCDKCYDAIMEIKDKVAKSGRW